MRSYPLPVYEYVYQELIWEISSLTEHIGNFTGAFDMCRVSIIRVISSPQCLDSGLRIRKEMSSTLYITLPAAAGVAEALPARTVWKAVTRRGSTDGGARSEERRVGKECRSRWSPSRERRKYQERQ